MVIGVQWIPDRNVQSTVSASSSFVKPSMSLIPPNSPPATSTPREKSDSASTALHANTTLKTGSSSPRSTSGALSDTSADPVSAATSSSVKPAATTEAASSVPSGLDEEDNSDTDQMGISSEESFHIPKFLPDPQSRGREVNPAVAPQYKKKKKISGVKDLDDLFGF